MGRGEVGRRHRGAGPAGAERGRPRLRLPAAAFPEPGAAPRRSSRRRWRRCPTRRPPGRAGRARCSSSERPPATSTPPSRSRGAAPSWRWAARRKRRYDDDHLRSGRREREEPRAVRRDLPREHDRGVPRRPERRGGRPRARRKALLDFVRGGRGSPVSTPRATPTTATPRRRRAARSTGTSSAAVSRIDDGRHERRREAVAPGSRPRSPRLVPEARPRRPPGASSRADFPQRFARCPSRRRPSAQRAGTARPRPRTSPPTSRSAPGRTSTG